MLKILKADFKKSCVEEKTFPEEIKKEFAFVGRSNVGKSSLINSLVNRKGLARTSRTPGRTQLINFFIINESFYCVDLPGYGFAKVSKEMKKNWGKTIENYLKSERKKIIFLLLDIRRVPNDDDLNLVEWLLHYDIDFRIIFTKSDKLSNNEKFRQMKEIKKVISIDDAEVFFYSALNGSGREELLDFIERKLAEEVVDEPVVEELADFADTTKE